MVCARILPTTLTSHYVDNIKITTNWEQQHRSIDIEQPCVHMKHITIDTLTIFHKNKVYHIVMATTAKYITLLLLRLDFFNGRCNLKFLYSSSNTIFFNFKFSTCISFILDLFLNHINFRNYQILLSTWRNCSLDSSHKK